VQEVLELDEIFPVPFGEKIKILDGGPNFLLGMKADAEYRRIQAQVMHAFRLEDVAKIVAPKSAARSHEIVSHAGGKLDAIQDLITLVPSLICEEYYGIPIPNKREFAQWTIAMSTFMFGDPTDNPAYRRCALAAGANVRPLVDNAIGSAKGMGGKAGSVLSELTDMQRTDPSLTDEVIRSYLIGMITGFVPTNTMAAGHMLEMLLRRPDFMAMTRSAALANDDERLKRCLFEAMRFMPLNPGPFRNCARDFTVAEGTRRAKRIRTGTKLIASTQSAMLDSGRIKSPYDFDPDRPKSNYMLFGYGLHWCIGAFIAEAQITQTLKALLVKKNLRRAPGRDGRLQLVGPFPAHLIVLFDP
jgi:cytochrome P450